MITEKVSKLAHRMEYRRDASQIMFVDPNSDAYLKAKRQLNGIGLSVETRGIADDDIVPLMYWWMSIQIGRGVRKLYTESDRNDTHRMSRVFADLSSFLRGLNGGAERSKKEDVRAEAMDNLERDVAAQYEAGIPLFNPEALSLLLGNFWETLSWRARDKYASARGTELRDMLLRFTGSQLRAGFSINNSEIGTTHMNISMRLILDHMNKTHAGYWLVAKLHNLAAAEYRFRAACCEPNNERRINHLCDARAHLNEAGLIDVHFSKEHGETTPASEGMRGTMRALDAAVCSSLKACLGADKVHHMNEGAMTYVPPAAFWERTGNLLRITPFAPIKAVGR